MPITIQFDKINIYLMLCYQKVSSFLSLKGILEVSEVFWKFLMYFGNFWGILEVSMRVLKLSEDFAKDRPSFGSVLLNFFLFICHM